MSRQNKYEDVVGENLHVMGPCDISAIRFVDSRQLIKAFFLPVWLNNIVEYMHNDTKKSIIYMYMGGLTQISNTCAI